MKRILYLLLLTALPLIGNAQVGIGTTTPDSSAALHIKSNSKGLLIPQISDTAGVYQPTANGLLVFIKDKGKFYVYDTIRGNWQCVNPLTSNSETGQLSPTEPYTGYTGYGTIPLGGIIMWSGDSIPPGWALCDGRSNSGRTTPDLRGRFIVGGIRQNPPHRAMDNSISDANYTNKGNLSTGGTNPGYTDGFRDVTLDTDQLPTHSHEIKVPAETIEVSPGAGIQLPIVQGNRENAAYSAITTTNHSGFTIQETGGTYTSGMHTNPSPEFRANCTVWPYTCISADDVIFFANANMRDYNDYIIVENTNTTFRGKEARLMSYYEANNYKGTTHPFQNGAIAASDGENDDIEGNHTISSCTENAVVDDTEEFDCRTEGFNRDYAPGEVYNTDESWTTQPFDNRPPYYVLAFIMRIR